jgi:hypothetical protein
MIEKADKGQVAFRPKPGLRGGYGKIRCPNPDCSHILFEASTRFWNTHQAEKVICPHCAHPASLFTFVQSENDAGELKAHYWCHRCNEGFDRIMIGIREYCRGCKTYQNIYFTLSMTLPPQPINQPQLKQAV